MDNHQRPTLQVAMTKEFRKDIKKLAPNQLCSPQFSEVMYLLQRDLTLPENYLDHPLKGQMNGYRDCHILNDLVLIYQILEKENKKELRLIRIGTHAALFK